jgi:hypothetical protein
MGHANLQTKMRYLHDKSEADAAKRLGAAFDDEQASGPDEKSDPAGSLVTSMTQAERSPVYPATVDPALPPDRYFPALATRTGRRWRTTSPVLTGASRVDATCVAALRRQRGTPL